MIRIIKASLENLEALTPLFDGYRVFYEQRSDIPGARGFLKDRLENDDSVIFLAFSKEVPIGFTQLFPSFSSVSMQAVWILNDLYVLPEHRGQGHGEALLKHAQRYCQETKCKGLALETAVDNPARQLYEKLGWKKDTHCFHYFWTAPES